MKQSIFKKTRYLLVAVFAFVFSITALVVGAPKAHAATEYDGYKVIDSIDLWTLYNNQSLTTIGNFTISRNVDQMTANPYNKTAEAIWKAYNANESVTITFNNTTGKKITNFVIIGRSPNGAKVEISGKDDVNPYTWTAITVDSYNGGTCQQGFPAGYSDKIIATFTLEEAPKSGYTYEQMTLVEFTVYEDDPGKPVNITGGTGIKSVYLSTEDNATSGSESGTGFEDGTVYGFVTLKEGYNADSTWTLISSTGDVEDAIYRVGSVEVYMESEDESYDLGTFNASPKTMTLTPKGNGIDDLDDITLTYDEAATVPAPTVVRTGCEFNCWNTKADGTGTDYTTSLSIPNVNSLIMSNTTLLYAKWVYDQTIQDLIDEIGGITVEYTGACKAAIDTALSHYEALSDDYKAVFPETSYNLLISKSNAYDAMDKINAIGTIANTPESKALVDAAKNFYDGLDSDTQALVLSDFVTTLNDAVAVMNAITKVNEIGDLDESDECRTKIDEAISAYSNLTTDQTNMFPTYTYNTLNDKDSAKTVIDKIKAIGNVEYSSESKGKIDNAQTAFNGLTEGQKALVSNYGKLVQANTDYDKVDEAVTKINSLPVFEYSDEYKEELDAVKGVYDALTDYQKSILPQDSLTKLNEALNEYEAIDSIFNIGTIENTTESKNRVKRAKDAYDNLTESQKATIPTDKVDYLLNAIVDFEVIDKINSVKNAGYSSKDKENIDSARTAYNALTTEQKEMFPASALALLSNIETAYPVMISINQLGKVEYTSDYKNKLDTIKAIYDSLTDSQKALVRNYVVLSVDEQSYNRVDDAYKAIEAIDKVKYNSSSRIAIEDARKCYNKLSNDERLLIKDEEEKLIKAEKKYEKAEHNHNVGMAWVTAICVIFGVVIVATGLWLLILLLLKKKREKEEENKKNNKKSKK